MPKKRRGVKFVENWEPAKIRGLKTPCHDCASHATNKGYPIIQGDNKKQLSIHRFLFQEKYGKLPKEIVVRHKCDNRLCINLSHCEKGTVADNTRDMMERKRFWIGANGESNKCHKLTEKEVIEILTEKNMSQNAMAKKYGVSHCTVWRILHGEKWKSVSQKLKIDNAI